MEEWEPYAEERFFQMIQGLCEAVQDIYSVRGFIDTWYHVALTLRNDFGMLPDNPRMPKIKTLVAHFCGEDIEVKILGEE